jgi:hypothetical protein
MHVLCRMSWLLPTPLLLFAAVVALWSRMSVARKPTSTPRLVAAGFAVSLAVIGLFWLHGQLTGGLGSAGERSRTPDLAPRSRPHHCICRR